MRITGRIVSSLFLLCVAVTAPGVVLYADDMPPVRLLVGRSMVVDVGTPISRVSLTSSDIADAMVTSSTQLLVNGKMPGTITMFVWERGGALRQYEVTVQRDLAILNEQMRKLFPGEQIDAQSNGKAIVLSGIVANKDLSDKASSVAAGYVDKAGDIVNLLRFQETVASNQVLLRVRFAEVSRSAMSELGVSLFTSPTGIKNTIARTTTQQFPAPGYEDLKWTKENGDFGSKVTSAEGKFTFSDFLNLFLFSEKYDIGAMVKALQVKGLFQSLAEPNLVAESGKEASFLAGGEIPIPIAQGSGGNTAISVQYKEFGIRLSFTPTVIGNRVHLKVKPEVSTLDFANGVVLQGFRIPALSTRRTETELELLDGQTFAIAGLMNNTVNTTLQKIPGIGDIPILGLLFKSKAAQKNQTELVVMITPTILPRNSPGVTPTLPRMTEPFMPAQPANKAVPMPAPAFTTPPPSAAVVTPAGKPARGARTADMTPEAAAAVMTGLGASSLPVKHVPDGQAAPATPDATAKATPSASASAAAARSHKDEERVKAAEARDRMKQLEVERRAAKINDLRQAKLAREQATRDAAAAKVAAADAKRQAELDRERQTAVNEANAKAKAAEAKYQAELSKLKTQRN
jgi:pilus assembly protein CpaC